MSRKGIWMCAVGLLLAAGGVVMSWFSAVNTRYEGDGPLWVYIPSGTGADSVASILEHVLPAPLGSDARKAWRLMRWADKEHTALSGGAYRVDDGMSMLDLARHIRSGQQTPVRLTFNNIRTLPELAARVGRTLEADSASFMAAVDTVLSRSGVAPERRIGCFMPDTYEFYWTTPAPRVVERLVAHRDAFWNNKRLIQAADLGLTPDQVAVVASIAEEETNAADERATVGRLYVNRIKRGMRLQADPTVKFAVGDFSLRRITGRHLAVESPYNTYLRDGLPPGPIRMPEARTIDAILTSAPHPYLYMCARSDMSGRHNFAITLADHQRNAAAYRRALDSRGIK